MHENIQIYNNHHIRKNFHYQSNNNKFLNIIKENDKNPMFNIFKNLFSQLR